MNLDNLTKTELKTKSYADLAYMLLKQGKTLNTAQLFKKICELLELTDEEYSNKIGDFYTTLTTDCRFLFLENAEWDLRDNHVVQVDMNDLEDEEDLEEDEEKEDELETEEDELGDEDIDNESLDDADLDEDLDDDLDDLSIIDEEEEAL